MGFAKEICERFVTKDHLGIIQGSFRDHLENRRKEERKYGEYKEKMRKNEGAIHDTLYNEGISGMRRGRGTI